MIDALGLGTYGVVGVHGSPSGRTCSLAAFLVGIMPPVPESREEPVILKPGQFSAGAAFVGIIIIYVLLTVMTGLP